MKAFSNFDEFRRKEREFRAKVNQAVKDSVEEAARYAEAEAKRGASAITASANGKTYRAVAADGGNHRRMINAKAVNNGFTARLNANADYAPYLEFGTGGLVDIPKGFEKLASEFKGKGIRQINLPARPHIIPAAYKARDFLSSQIEKKINDL